LSFDTFSPERNGRIDAKFRRATRMTFIVTENCKGCRFTDCVAVCPVDCFHGDEEMLYIDPDECIDCGACVPECPVEAIFDETQLPDDQKAWLQINADRAKNLPVVNEKGDALPGAEERKAKLGF
jgi:ferredoxin